MQQPIATRLDVSKEQIHAMAADKLAGCDCFVLIVRDRDGGIHHLSSAAIPDAIMLLQIANKQQLEAAVGLLSGQIQGGPAGPVQ